jgi:hypothetical protein
MTRGWLFQNWTKHRHRSIRPGGTRWHYLSTLHKQGMFLTSIETDLIIAGEIIADVHREWR